MDWAGDLKIRRGRPPIRGGYCPDRRHGYGKGPWQVDYAVADGIPISIGS